MRLRSSLVLAFSLWATTFALEVAPNSPCALKCIDQSLGDVSDSASSSTYPEDLFCNDWEIVGSDSTIAGRKFKDCNNCLKSSGFASDKAEESDIGWFLFNSRAVVDWCVFARFGDREETNRTETKLSKHCSSRCSNLYEATNYQITTAQDSYRFCDTSGNFSENGEDCLNCIHEASGLTMLGNTLATVMDMCKKKPTKTYNFPKDQEIFGTTRISLSNTTESSSPTSSALAQSPPSSKSSGLSVGALAGIILGALTGVILILCGILLLFRRRKSKSKAKAMAVEIDTRSANSGIPPSYRYSPVEEPRKDAYAYNTELDAQYPTMELPTHTAISELPTGNVNSPTR